MIGYPIAPHPIALALVALLVVACAGAQDVGLERVADGLDRPIGIVTDGSNADRTYVLEQSGTVRIVEGDTVRPEPFLDVSDRVSVGGERGLLGLAFHPDYPDVAEVFVHFSDVNGDTMLQRMPVVEGRADPERATVMLQVAQPYGNHNGGQLAFGPDRHLYLGLGDGGSGGDPHGHGQDPSTLLGTLLRLDVSGEPYAIPPDNPFVGDDAARDEIWAYGLRNPWRFSFAPDGALWIADVGQNAVEEVNRQPADAGGGQNYGWNRLEGDACFLEEGCSSDGTVLPVLTYRHADGWGRSVTGGYLYDGEALAHLRGAYVFGDYVGGTILVARERDGEWEAELLLETGFPVTSFGLDPAGELLVADHGGGLWRLAPR